MFKWNRPSIQKRRI